MCSRCFFASPARPQETEFEEYDLMEEQSLFATSDQAGRAHTRLRGQASPPSLFSLPRASRGSFFWGVPLILVSLTPDFCGVPAMRRPQEDARRWNSEGLVWTRFDVSLRSEHAAPLRRCHTLRHGFASRRCTDFKD